MSKNTNNNDKTEKYDISDKATYYEVMPVLYGIFRNTKFEELDVPAWCVPKLESLTHSGYLVAEPYEDLGSENGIVTLYHIPKAFTWDLMCLCEAYSRMIPDNM